MKITKYGHACVVLEEHGQRLVIDPGNWTADFGSLDTIIGVVITHNHADHYSGEHVIAIKKANPQAQIFGPSEVAADTGPLGAMIVSAGTTARAGSFSLKFYGGDHALIHKDFPELPHNVGVCVNDIFYYGGDSLTLPEKPIRALAVPASGPWLKEAEAIDFVRAAKPEICFPTHNAILSDVGEQLVDSWLQRACDMVHAKYYSLKPGEYIEV